jgi:hypothetical protein
LRCSFEFSRDLRPIPLRVVARGNLTHPETALDYRWVITQYLRDDGRMSDQLLSVLTLRNHGAQVALGFREQLQTLEVGLVLLSNLVVSRGSLG